jgi:hypothetical protein
MANNATGAPVIGALTGKVVAEQRNTASASFPFVSLLAVVNAAQYYSAQASVTMGPLSTSIRADAANRSTARVTQIVSEALITGTPRVRVSQTVQEVLAGGIGAQNVRITQSALAVLAGGIANQRVMMTQVALAVLVSAVAIDQSTTFIMV